MSNENVQLEEIASELQRIEFGDKNQLASLLRKTEVYLKKVFGRDSEYYERYCNLSFVPEGVNYNTGNYKNEEEWNIGMANFRSLIETVSYEFELNHLNKSVELVYPNQVTFYWIKAHVPIKFWLSFAGLLIAAFLAGVTASEYGISNWFVSSNEAETQVNEKSKPNN